MSKRKRKRTKAPAHLPLATKARACDGCTACCTVLHVAEAGTGTYEPCALQVDGGCGVYETKPSACNKYACWWRRDGAFKTKDRPDRVGVIFDDETDGLGAPIWRKVPKTVTAREVRPGAFNTPRLKRIRRELLEQGYVIAYQFHGLDYRLLMNRERIEFPASRHAELVRVGIIVER